MRQESVGISPHILLHEYKCNCCHLLTLLKHFSFWLVVFMVFMHQLYLTKLHCVAIPLWTSVSINDIPIQFIEYLKKMTKKNLYSLIETVGVD